MIIKRYSAGSEVHGWQGWVETEKGTLIAFVTDDGRFVFGW